MKNKSLISQLNDDEINDISKYAPEFKETYSKDISRKFKMKAKIEKKSKFKRNGLVAACLALSFTMFSGAVYAGVINLNSVYEWAFGSGGEYISQYGEVIDGGNEVDGIKLQLLSAIKDEEKLIVFFTLTDTKGDRLSETIDLHDSWMLDQGGGGNCKLINYDSDTKTATFQITSVGGSTNKTATLTIKEFLSSLKFKENLVENNVDVYSELSNHIADKGNFKELQKNGFGGGIAENSKYRNKMEEMNILKQNQLTVPLSLLDWINISNIGFIDGELHIQFNYTKDTFNNITMLSFVNADGKAMYQSESNVGYSKVSQKNDFRNSNNYDEFVFENIKDISQIKDLKLSFGTAEYGDLKTGNWKASFKVPSQASKIKIPVNEKIKLQNEEVDAHDMILSPLGLTIKYKSNSEGSQNENNDSAYVTYEDGTVINFQFASFDHSSKENTCNFSDPVIEIEKVKSVNINGVEISVEKSK